MQQMGLAASLTSLPTASTLAGIRGSLPDQYHSLEDPTTQGSRLGGTLSQTFQIAKPSRILRIQNIADFANTCKLEKFCGLYSDIYDECILFGPVIGIKIPRQVFFDRSDENAKEDAIKLENEAIIENKKAAADPRYIKQSERRKARL